MSDQPVTTAPPQPREPWTVPSADPIIPAVSTADEPIAPEPPVLDWNPAEDCFAVEVAVGGDHACALTDLGHVYCWGHNDSRQLGVLEVDDRCAFGDTAVACSHEPVAVAGVKDAIELSLSSSASCALDDAGIVRCWGVSQSDVFSASTRAQCDLASLDDPRAQHLSCSPFPSVIAGIDHAVALGAWGVHCAAELGGAVKCWEGHMGRTPMAVPSVTGAVQTDFSCALTAAGQVQCWWCNDLGQRGDGTLAPPQQVGVGSNCQLTTSTVAFQGRAVQVSSGYQHVCLVDTEGGVHCWGDNLAGQLGVPSVETPICNYEGPCAVSPVRMPGVDDALAVAAGLAFTCVLHEGGEVRCVGGGRQRWVELPAPAVQLAARYSTSCAVLSDGRVVCWSPGSSRAPETVSLCDISARSP